MKRLFFLLVVLSISMLARADDQTQAIQQALKDKGFYYGTVDGQAGPETDAAIRRFQIREGLEVTGKLDAQTLSSLDLGGGSQDGNTLQAVPPPSDQSANAQPDQAQTPPPDVVRSDHDILRSQPQAAAPDDQGAAQPPEQAQPQAPEEQPQAPEVQPQPFEQGAPSQPQAQPYEGQSVPPQYAHFFRKTPYETAPPGVQRATVQQAQVRLAREGFFRGVADGQVSDSLSRALAGYQSDAGLRVTGRLDMDTLAELNLLPRRHVMVAPPIPYGPGPYGPPGVVYRGIWVH
jgi:peptidoglycan hydrolase-like protein with peptidoglycan-binding domain